jgi:hypothetical protein
MNKAIASPLIAKDNVSIPSKLLLFARWFRVGLILLLTVSTAHNFWNIYQAMP